MSEAILGDLKYFPEAHYWCLHVGWQLGRLEFLFDNTGFDEETNRAVAEASVSAIQDIRRHLTPQGISLHDEFQSFPEISARLIADISERRGEECTAFLMIGLAAIRLSMTSSSSNPDHNDEMRQLARSCLTGITGVYIADKDEFFERLITAEIGSPAELADLLQTLGPRREQVNSPRPNTTVDSITVLFVAADPTNAARLRLGEEYRNIQQMLQIAKYRDQFRLCERFSARISDLTQAILDEEPRIVHFSGHGTDSGALCLESASGDIQEVKPEALARLFGAARGVECVVMNACFSATQASAIVAQVPFVIGMDKAIGDHAAILFALGFYQALGAGRSIPDAFAFGTVQVDLSDVPEALTPQLLRRSE